MRNVAIMLLATVSLSSMAATKITMTSDAYSTEAVLTAADQTMMAGTFANETARYGQCEGTFRVVPKAETMTVSIGFEDARCNLQSMDITMTIQSFQQFMQGNAVEVKFKQLQFYRAEMSATLKITG